MKEFLRRHEGRIHSTLSCFDRMLFRGYPPLFCDKAGLVLRAETVIAIVNRVGQPMHPRNSCGLRMHRRKVLV